MDPHVLECSTVSCAGHAVFFIWAGRAVYPLCVALHQWSCISSTGTEMHVNMRRNAMGRNVGVFSSRFCNFESSSQFRVSTGYSLGLNRVADGLYKADVISQQQPAQSAGPSSVSEGLQLLGSCSGPGSTHRGTRTRAARRASVQ